MDRSSLMQFSTFSRAMLAAAVACGTLTGCAVGPKYRAPLPKVSTEWIEPNPTLPPVAPRSEKWWTALNDPILDQLVQDVYRQNLSLRVAGLRVIESRAQRGIAAGQFWPQVQSLRFDYSAAQLSERSSPGGAPARTDKTFESNSAGLDMAWELDLWGRFRRNIESADANLLASVYSYEDVLVSLIAETATAYVDQRTFEERLDLALRNVDLQRKTLSITETRFKNGVVSELDVAQAKANLTNTEALLPGFRDGARQAQNRLCVLLGIPAQDLKARMGSVAKIPQVPTEIAIGIPVDLVRRRPDVRSAERQAAAQSAQIGVAFSDMLPIFSLKGSLGVDANNFGDLGTKPAFTYVGGPSVTWNILNYGRIRNNVRVQDARFEQLAVNYENTVLRALAETESALSGFMRAREQVASLGQSVAAALRASELARIQYNEGSVDFIRLLNSDTFLVLQQDNLAQARGLEVQNIIRLNRALGGGWELQGSDEFVPADTVEKMRKRTNWGSVLKPGYEKKNDVLWERPDIEKDRARDLFLDPSVKSEKSESSK